MWEEPSLSTIPYADLGARETARLGRVCGERVQLWSVRVFHDVFGIAGLRGLVLGSAIGLGLQRFESISLPLFLVFNFPFSSRTS